VQLNVLFQGRRQLITVILEADEIAHIHGYKGYATDKETFRLRRLQAALGTPCFVLRYNVDGVDAFAPENLSAYFTRILEVFDGAWELACTAPGLIWTEYRLYPEERVVELQAELKTQQELNQPALPAMPSAVVGRGASGASGASGAGGGQGGPVLAAAAAAAAAADSSDLDGESFIYFVDPSDGRV
jgi:hypothetical protein